MKNCKAYNVKCSNCNFFGHLRTCSMDFTKSRARKDRDKAISKVEDDTVEDVKHVNLHHVGRKEEKKIRQRQR